jgi:hypothetical protein
VVLSNLALKDCASWYLKIVVRKDSTVSANSKLCGEAEAVCVCYTGIHYLKQENLNSSVGTAFSCVVLKGSTSWYLMEDSIKKRNFTGPVHSAQNRTQYLKSVIFTYQPGDLQWEPCDSSPPARVRYSEWPAWSLITQRGERRVCNEHALQCTEHLSLRDHVSLLSSDSINDVSHAGAACGHGKKHNKSGGVRRRMKKEAKRKEEEEKKEKERKEEKERIEREIDDGKVAGIAFFWLEFA